MAPEISALSQTTPLKIANSAPMWATSDVEGCFLSVLIFPFYSHNENIPHALSFTHLFIGV